MPRHLSPLRLKDRCIDSIARNIDTWCENFVDGYINQGIVCRYVIGPFEYLTSDLIENIIKALLDRKMLKRHHLELLLQTRVNQLNLSLCNKTLPINNSFLLTVGFRLTSLRNLCLDLCKNISPSCLIDVLSSMPQIQSLSLGWSKTNDSVVAAICENCLALRELSLQGCACVTDKSIDAIIHCTTEENLNCSCRSGQPALKHLSRLNVSETRVTANGLRRTLSHLSSLRHLHHEDGVLAFCGNDLKIISNLNSNFNHVIQSLTQTSLTPANNNNNSKTQQFPLFDSVHAKDFVESFPHLNSLVLHTKLSDNAVLCLSRLRCLARLDLYDSSETLTFSGGILPLLTACGSTLRELTLNELDEVDLLAVLGLCSESLTSLFCLGVTFFSETYSFPGDVINQTCSLRSLHVLPFGENNLSFIELQKVLQMCVQITNIHLNNIQVIDDGLLGKVLLHNPLKHLSEACFTDCNRINSDFVISLLNQESDLTHLKLVDCLSINRSDFPEFVSCILDNNFNACIEIQYDNVFSLIHPPR